MSLDVVIECIIWHLILLSSKNSDNKRRGNVCAVEYKGLSCSGLLALDLFAVTQVGTGNRNQLTASAALPEARSKPAASSEWQ